MFFTGSVIVIICCVLVKLMSGNEDVSKYVDPVVSVVACIVLLTLSYPYSKKLIDISYVSQSLTLY